MEERILKLLAIHNIEPNDVGLFKMAFTHKSMNGHLKSEHRDYERLEFLGDSVVNLVTAELCYVCHPNMSSGDLSKLRAQFICTAAEANYARELKLDSCLLVGPSLGEEGKKADNILEDVFESFLGALYLDQGQAFALNFVRKLLTERIKAAEIRVELNPKSTLQEAVQSDNRGDLSYVVLKESGTPNDKTFTVGVFLDGHELGEGIGKSKKAAETAAASDALSKLAI